ncbi:ATP-dependent DNA helicase 2 subunit KU70 [Tetrabaena socialis]|uniref:ATP-dependent DNA helicase 2 subunit KU70 n=1 Tax=Tetrabaena socialis TaxID=47790 RepID=A0A2J8A0K4_9CHLO|nr:ATP-dependent DNA helicase 2 subunit KU70 [Tetrabaena socialis]|eukprot:PNH06049.1 ATP-dependent DNA helicase 2 subunit KU70 [Tetrabaena socialis]
MPEVAHERHEQHGAVLVAHVHHVLAAQRAAQWCTVADASALQATSTLAVVPGKREKVSAASTARSIDWDPLARAGNLSTLTIDQLKVYLKRHQLKLSGKKQELVERVLDHMGLKE